MKTKTTILIIFMLFLTGILFAEDKGKEVLDNYYLNKNVDVEYTYGAGASSEEGVIIEITDKGILIETKNEYLFLFYNYIVRLAVKKS